MPKFLALTSKGLVDPLYEEMQELGLNRLNKLSAGVSFEGNWRDCYLANVKLKSATRVALTILDFPAYQPEELYQNIKKHDFTKYIEPHQTLAIKAKVSDSTKWQDQRYVTLKAKDAIVDQFREKYDFRPNVDSKNPDLLILIKVFKNQFSVSVDTSGKSLAHRGYRVNSVEAPLREHLAAGLLKIAKWDPAICLLDPFCGSGTFLTEAALMALPQRIHREYGFERFKIFQEDTYEKLKAEFAEERPLELDLKLYGSDNDNVTILKAKENIRKAGVSEYVKVSSRDFRNIKAPCEKGMIIMNPPYGVRLDEVEELKKLYFQISQKMKEEFVGWELWLLSGDSELSKALKFKADEKYFVYNGGIECRFLKYTIR
ncbi:MAG: RNA methyltransferase [Bdellovibrionaceae bacterium]|jgi:23S rRNA G2445 N2-methylase RlmL|nr:RNA methyltransferase [Pseudobdellovibrionaceae bacterium]